jgi:hypothetical protein
LQDRDPEHFIKDKTKVIFFHWPEAVHLHLPLQIKPLRIFFFLDK